jgi:RNA polymerase sigma-70 factor (ECF subfamily)
LAKASSFFWFFPGNPFHPDAVQNSVKAAQTGKNSVMPEENNYSRYDGKLMQAAVKQEIMFSPGIKIKDDELVRKIRLGDSRAMQTLYGRHSERLFTLAIRLTGNKADAQEVVQDSFVKAWRNIDKFRGDSSIGTWLYRIAMNLSRDVTKRRRSYGQEIEVAVQPTSSDAFARKALEKALSNLPDGYREVLVMHDVMEMRHPEISDVLKIAVGTSKSQLHKARAQMRQILKKGGMEKRI